MKKELLKMDERMNNANERLDLTKDEEKFLKNNLLYRMIMLFD
ncbi:MAG: hypothetical protein RR561_08955 [Peptostreptococcus sp.]|nr:hypothetical protein [Peptostreptococcus russellii]